MVTCRSCRVQAEWLQVYKFRFSRTCLAMDALVEDMELYQAYRTQLELYHTMIRAGEEYIRTHTHL